MHVDHDQALLGQYASEAAQLGDSPIAARPGRLRCVGDGLPDYVLVQ